MGQELAAQYQRCLLLGFAALCPPALRNHVTWLKISFTVCCFLVQVHQFYQQQQLSALREKAKLEVQASQRFLSELLQPSSEVSGGFRSSVTAAAPSVMLLQYSLLFLSPH